MKNKKRILTILTASVLSATAIVPFASSAESAESASKDIIIAELEKKLDAIMEDESFVKSINGFPDLIRPDYAKSEDEKNQKFLAYMGEFKAEDEKTEIRLYSIDPDILTIVLDLPEGVSNTDINDFIKKKYPDCPKFNNYNKAETNTIKSYITKNNAAVNAKAIIELLKENNMISSVKLEYGSFWNHSGHLPLHLQTPMSWFQSFDQFKKDYSFITVPESYNSTNKEILNYYAAGNIDCDFGIVVRKKELPEGVEYIAHEEMFPDNEFDLLQEDYFGYIALTPEEAANLDEKVIDAIAYFSAKPKEMTLENQCDLLIEINKNVQIKAMDTYSLQSQGNGEEISGLEVDVTNYLNGDANCDQKYSIADSTAILQALGNPDKYGLSMQGLFNADSTGDGLTVEDAVAIKTALAKGV